MGDPARRIQQYEAKVTAQRSSTDLTSQLGDMTPNAAVVFNQIAQMEAQVRQVLNAMGVPTITYPAYFNFGRQVWARIRRGISGESLAQETAVLMAYWVAQGLTQPVLRGIRSEVFNVPSPIAP